VFCARRLHWGEDAGRSAVRCRSSTNQMGLAASLGEFHNRPREFVSENLWRKCAGQPVGSVPINSRDSGP
jgi:hypothetical protein